MAKKRKNESLPERPRNELRMQRHTQRAHKFTDRKREASRKACRGRVYA